MYEALLEVQEACLHLVYPGALSLNDIYSEMLRLLGRQLQRLGVIPKKLSSTQLLQVCLVWLCVYLKVSSGYQNLRSMFGIEHHLYTKSHIDQIPCVCMCNYSSQTTEPICIKIIPANRASYADSCRLLRFEIFTPTIFKTPEPSKKGVNTHFKPNYHNIETHIFRPQFAWFHRNLARWCSLTLLTVTNAKNFKFWKSKMAAAAILKNHHISAAVRAIATKFGTVRPSWPFWPLHFSNLVRGGGRYLENGKIVISQPRFKWLRRNLARWCISTLLTITNVKNFKFWKSKMVAAAILKNRKIAISWPQFERFLRN